MSNVHGPAFAGLLTVLNPTNTSNLADDIADDMEGEQETLPNLTANDVEDDKAANAIVSQWRDSVTGASKRVTEKTHSEYQNLAIQCSNFLIAHGLITRSEDFFCQKPPQDAPLYITAWIMNQCDEILLNGSKKPSSERRDSYTHAQKMRASMTYTFGRVHGLGSSSWHRSEISGQMIGNPSVSESVASYMISLRNRKVHAGEVATSARAITSEILEKLYDFNHRPENHELKDYMAGSRSRKVKSDQWGGGMSRRVLGTIYAVAFLCLLRADEVLKIQRHHVEWVIDPPRMVLTLPFRKTHQDGGIKPFVLYAMPEEEAYICPVRAMAEWVSASQITTGYLFRRMASGDRLSERNVPLTSEQFLEMFRNNLLDIAIDPSPYGTHSFRRGGCQYLASYRRWSLRAICEWGGWSTEFSNLTIVKYLISWNDDPTQQREDFFNPNRPPAVKCFVCGRSCHCA